MERALTVRTDFDELIDAVMHAVASPQSARAYMSDYQDWRDWCDEFQEDPAFPTYRTVAAYLERIAQHGASRATVRRRLAALRKLTELGAALDYSNPAREAAHKSLKLLKPRYGHENERSKRALLPSQVDRALRTWDSPTLLHTRNRAMMGVLFCCGLRRGEVSALKWDDIDLEKNIIHVRHGKGDKERYIPIYGDQTPRALKAWRALSAEGREYVFPRMYREDVIGDDEPITTDGIAYIAQETVKRTGDYFSPHDARRTFITEALETGHTLADVKADAGHRREDTTLGYAQPSDAQERRRRGRLRYG